MHNCPRQLVVQWCVLCSFVRCGTSKQIEKERKKNYVYILLCFPNNIFHNKIKEKRRKQFYNNKSLIIFIATGCVQQVLMILAFVFIIAQACIRTEKICLVTRTNIIYTALHLQRVNSTITSGTALFIIFFLVQWITKLYPTVAYCFR